MSTNKKLDAYWDEFVDTFIRALLKDGYDEFEILDKMMSVFRNVRKKYEVVSLDLTPVVFTPAESIDQIEPISTVESTPEIRTRKSPEHRKSIDRSKNPNNYSKSLSSKFLHAKVFVRGTHDESLATIEYGTSAKSRDVFRLVRNGIRYTEVDYLKRFNRNVADTPAGMAYLNRHAILFEDNPNISVGYVKNNAHYSKFNNINDIKNYPHVQRGGRKGTKD